MKKRAQTLGLHVNGTPGEQNGIVDVPGILVGNTTLSIDPSVKTPQVRTGVTWSCDAFAPR